MALVEVLVAVVLLAGTMLATGHAIASALRLGHRGLVEARLAAALAVQVSLIESAAQAGMSCRTLASGERREGALSIRWRPASLRHPALVLLEAELQARGQRVADSVAVLLACP